MMIIRQSIAHSSYPSVAYVKIAQLVCASCQAMIFFMPVEERRRMNDCKDVALLKVLPTL